MTKKSLETELLESSRHSTDTPSGSLETIDEELFGDLEIERTTKSKANLDIIKLPPNKITLSRGVPAPVISAQAVIAPAPSKMPLFLALGFLLLVGGGVGSYFAFFATTSPLPSSQPVGAERQAVRLSSDPLGATVFIDDKRYQDPTPLTVRLLVGKLHKIRLEKKGYKPAIQALTPVKQAAITEIKLPLLIDASQPPDTTDGGPSDAAPHAPLPPADPATLGVFTPECSPADLDIVLPGRPPVSCKKGRLDLPAGSYRVQFKKPGYRSQTRTLVIEAQKTTSLSIRLLQGQAVLPRGPIVAGGTEWSITSSPPAKVLWRGKTIGKTPFKHRFPAGKHKLTFEIPHLYASKEKEITVKPGQSDTANLTFGKGKIRFFIKPWADVFLNGKKIGQTPMPPHSTWQGVYRVELKMNDKTFQQMIRLNEGQELKVVHSF